MELLYLWIEDYKNIQNQGFNFNSKWKFDYQNEQLTVEERPNAIDNFFGKDIVNITALVGANGSGKTSVLEFLYKAGIFENALNFRHHKNFKYIITYSYAINNNSFFFLVVDWSFSPFNPSSNSLIVNKDSFTEEFNLASDRELSPEKELPHEEINYAIYYSPFIRRRELYTELNLSPDTNISTGRLLKKHIQRDGNGNSINRTNATYLDRIGNYELNESLSLVEFIDYTKSQEDENAFFSQLSKKNTALAFNLPSLDYSSKTTIQEIQKQLTYLNFQNELEVFSFINFFNNRRIKGSSIQQKNFSFLRSITLNLFHIITSNLLITPLLENDLKIEEKSLATSLDVYTKVKRFNKNPRHNRFDLDTYISILETYLLDIFSKSTFTYTSETHKYSIQQIFSFFYQLIEEESETSLSSFTSITASTEDIKEAFRQERIYFMLIEETFNNKFKNSNFGSINNEIGFLRSDIQNMSSGEKHYLQLFSRFYRLRYKVTMGNTESLLILIDEGETSLHPQWQKQYIKLLTKTLPLIFKDTPIQIILTSHSPFIVSDLPKENIIFLDTDEQNNTKVVDGLKQKETFGANIHTLFTDAFFMDGGLMGDFAKEKINAVIKYLNQKESSSKENKQAQQYINLIGEPIIKRQLQKMLDSKRLTKADDNEKNIDKMKQTLNALKEQVRLLENQINPSNNDSDKS